MKKIIKRLSLLMALQMTLAVAVAFSAGGLWATMFNLGNSYIAGIWCGISTIVVMQAHHERTYEAAWVRIWGSFFGSLIAFIFIYCFGYNLWALWLSIFFTIVIVSLCRLKRTLRLSCLTVLIIIGVGMYLPDIAPWKNAFSRFIESVLGTLIAILFSYGFYPLRKKFDLLGP